MATSKSTLPPKTPGEETDPFNRAELKAQEQLQGPWGVSDDDQSEALLRDAAKEQDARLFPDSADAVREAEENPSLPGKRDGLYNATGKKKPGRFNKRALLRKGTPIGALVTLVVGAGIGFSAFFSPSILIIHMKEIMVEKFNTQLASTDIQSNRLLKTKIDQSTAGLCKGPVTIKCRFSTMSEKQVTNFKNAGITVLPEEPNAGKRTKPTGYIFEGKQISASDFARVAKNDVQFRIALRKAYNPKYGAFTGKAWEGVKKIFGFSKVKTDIKGETDDERMKSLNDIAKNGESTTGTPRTAADFEAACANDPDPDCADKRAAAYNDALNKVDSTDGSFAKQKVASFMSGTTFSSITNVAKITQIADDVCIAYSAIQLLGYAAKTVRAIQLARYAMVFLKAADELKSAEGMTPETAAFLGGVLTEITYDIKSTNNRIKRGSATDSLGYKFAAFGDLSSGSKERDNIAARYLAGGGFTGELIEFSNAVTSFFGGRDATRVGCATLANPFVQAGSIVVGIAVLFVPGANVAKIAASAISGALIHIGLAMIPMLLADIVAGTVTEGIKGEESGNAIASGSGGLMSDKLAGFNGNGPVTIDDAVQYATLQKKKVAEYGEDIRLATSPFDPTTRHSFLGGMISSIIPTLNSSDTAVMSGSLNTLGSLLTTSFSKLIPTTSALSDAQERAAMNMCQDFDIKESGTASDPFCNVWRLIPVKYLDEEDEYYDPIAIMERLEDDGLLLANEAMSQEHALFVQECIESENPLGYNDNGEFILDDAKKCIVSDENVDIYLYFMSKRMEEGQSKEEIEEPAAPTGGNSGATGAVVPPVDPGYAISSPFNDPTYSGTPPHKGTDISGYPGGSMGKPVYAIAAGTVVMSGRGKGCGGNNDTRIQLANGEIVGYLHMNGADITVGVGDKVTPGQLIGKIASCGQSTGPHLHFEMMPGSNTEGWFAALPRVSKYGGIYVDPVAYLAHYGVKL